MGLRCSRLSCQAEANASMQFDASLSQAMLIDLGPRTAGMPLCGEHAETRTAPVGWEIIDHRTGAGHTTWESTEQVVSEAVTERPSKRRPETDEPKKPAADEPGFSFKNRAEDDETPEELAPASPLLSRAFRAANG
jgi:hypothetical protein